MIKIGYITLEDPRSDRAWSGLHMHMFDALVAQGFMVRHVGASLWPPRASLPRRAWRKLRSSSRKPVKWGHDDAVTEAKTNARGLEAELASADFDALFAPAGKANVAFLNTPLPIIGLTDGTFASMRNYYGAFAGLSEAAAAQQDELERRSIARSNLFVVSSEWAAKSVVGDYGADPAKVRVFPFGANTETPRADELPRREVEATCRLLFVGRDWQRKGGEIALGATERLRKDGIDAHLYICGCNPPTKSVPPHVHLEGVLEKSNPDQRQRLHELFMRSHLFVLPSRAECLAVVLCEAAAYGLPAIATNTGGISSILRDQYSGALAPADASAADFANAIKSVWQPEKYGEMSRNARALYDQYLNWNAWGAAMRREIEMLARPSNQSARP